MLHIFFMSIDQKTHHSAFGYHKAIGYSPYLLDYINMQTLSRVRFKMWRNTSSDVIALSHSLFIQHNTHKWSHIWATIKQDQKDKIGKLQTKDM